MFSRPEILAYKPARTIVTHLGYHGAIGLSQVDFKLTDRVADVADAGDYQIERPLAMASCVLPFRRASVGVTAPPARAALGLAAACARARRVRTGAQALAALPWVVARDPRARARCGAPVFAVGACRAGRISAPARRLRHRSGARRLRPARRRRSRRKGALRARRPRARHASLLGRRHDARGARRRHPGRHVDRYAPCRADEREHNAAHESRRAGGGDGGGVRGACRRIADGSRATRDRGRRRPGEVRRGGGELPRALHPRSRSRARRSDRPRTNPSRTERTDAPAHPRHLRHVHGRHRRDREGGRASRDRLRRQRLSADEHAARARSASVSPRAGSPAQLDRRRARTPTSSSSATSSRAAIR